MNQDSVFTGPAEKIFSRLPNGIVTIRGPEGRIVFCNQAAAELLELYAEDLPGRLIEEFIDLGKFREAALSGSGYETGEILLMNRKQSAVSQCIALSDGPKRAAVIVFQDASQDRLRNLEVLNQELNAIIESSYDGIWITNGEGITLRVNKSYEKFSGIKATEVVGRSLKDLVKEGYYSDSAALHALEKKEPVTLVHKIKTGKKAIVTANPIFDEQGKIRLVITNVRDITLFDNLQQKLAELERLSKGYQYELQQLQKDIPIIGCSKAIQDVITLAMRVAEVDTTVFVQGESGVGKGLIAELIHAHSRRKEGPFIKVNCGAIPETLLESELFGYEKGAFTGAKKEGKIGLFEMANDGTLFLDEIAEVPILLQVKLLQAIQDQAVYRVGGTRLINLNLRIITATNKNISELVRNGNFREDLYYRLNVIPCVLPPLRDRREDIPLLITHFLGIYNKKFALNKKLALEAVDCLINYSWPGNIREVENVVQRMILLSGDSIETGDLPENIRNSSRPGEAGPPDCTDGQNLRQALEELEKGRIKAALLAHGSTRRAARRLGIDQSTLVRKARKHRITLDPSSGRSREFSPDPDSNEAPRKGKSPRR